MKLPENAGYYAGGGILALITGIFVKRKLDSRPAIGDVASVPLMKIQVTGAPPVSGIVPTALAQLTPVAGNLLVRVTAPTSSTGIVTGIAGAGIPVTFLRTDIVGMSRNGVAITNPAG